MSRIRGPSSQQIDRIEIEVDPSEGPARQKQKAMIDPPGPESFGATRRRRLEEVRDSNSGSAVILMPQHRLNSELQVAHAGYFHAVVRSMRNVAVDIKFKKNAAAGGKAQRERHVLHGTQSGYSQVTAVPILHLKNAGPVKLGGIGSRRTSWNNELRVSGGLR